VVYWDADARKDLLVGLADGRVLIFLNIGTDDEPTFDGGTFLQVGRPGAKTDISVGGRANSTVADWNDDSMKDLVVGALDGKIHLFLNEGTDTSPDFVSETYAQEDGEDLVVPCEFPPGRSSPVVRDLDGDGKKDLLTGNTDGELLFYSNVGTSGAPSFSGYVLVESDGVPIDLPGSPRSRPFVCDWTEDRALDVLIGAGDGKVYLYQGVLTPDDLDDDGDVDLDDFAILHPCLGGPGEPPTSCCEPSDLDEDGDVDLADFAAFEAGFTG
jgi:hypothetical protein